MILNPYFWLGLLVWTALLGAGSYLKGSKSAQDAAGARHAKELAQTIAQWRETAQEDARAAFAAAEGRQKAKVEFRDRVVTVEKVLHAKPQNPECALPDDAVGLLNDAIRAANHSAPAAERAIVPAAAVAK